MMYIFILLGLISLGVSFMFLVEYLNIEIDWDDLEERKDD